MEKKSPRILRINQPFADKLVLTLAKIFGLLAAFSVIVSIIYFFWVGWAFTAKLRELLDSTFWSALIYLSTVVILSVIGMLITRYVPRMVLGEPVFGELGGLPRHMFSAAMRARPNIKIELHDQDLALAKKFNIIQVRIMHDTLKSKFIQLHQGKSGLDTDWASAWNNEILNMSFGGQRFAEAADINKFGINYAISTLVRSTYMFPPIASVFWAITIFIIYSFANQHLELLTTIQASLFLTFVLSAFWYTFVLHTLSVYPLSFIGLEIPGSVRNEFSNDIDALEGMEIQPKEIVIKKKFYKIIRNYQLRLLIGGSFSEIILLLFLLGASYSITYLINPAYAQAVASYHTTMAYGVLFIGAGFSLSFYLFSIIIENARQIVAALALAVLSAGLPFIIDYLLGGTLNISGIREAVFAGSGGLTVALITAVTSHVKETLNE